MPEIRQYSTLENPCYMDENNKLRYNNFSRNFSKGEKDPEYWWMLKENYNNTELCWN